MSGKLEGNDHWTIGDKIGASMDWDRMLEWFRKRNLKKKGLRGPKPDYKPFAFSMFKPAPSYYIMTLYGLQKKYHDFYGF